MKVGMIQSNYIPWRGYFDFIDDVDLFLFYDDVQYTHRDWRNRNRIKTRNGPVWLSVPVVHNSETLIQDARIDYQNRWVEKHLRTLRFEYRASAHLANYIDEFSDILQSRPATISGLNVAICRWVMGKLGIRTETRMSSEFCVSGDKFVRPLTILKRIGATSYLSGPSAKPYTDPRAFAEAGVRLEYKTYTYSEYPQLHGPFEPNLTVLDLLFNCGEASRNHLKSLSPTTSP
jgi:hypothetical protein